MIMDVEWVGERNVEECHASQCRYWSKGYAIDSDGLCYIDNEISHLFLSNLNNAKITASRLNGCFSAIIISSCKSYFISDRFGTVPIYYYVRKSGNLIISDDPWRVIASMDKLPQIEEASLSDLLYTGYVTGIKTLIKGVHVIGPSRITMFCDNKLTEDRYWFYQYRPQFGCLNELSEELRSIFRHIILRSERILEKRSVAPLLTLSGGLDSRLLTALFCNDTEIKPSTISYGNANDPEVQVARQVASSLNLIHRIVPVDNNIFSDDFISESVRQVGITTRFTCGTGARYFAKFQREILIPGHTGDFISGGHLPPHVGLVHNRKQLCQFLSLRHYQYVWSDKIMRQCCDFSNNFVWENLNYTTKDFDLKHDMFGLIDRWNVENRQRRLILMELRAYEQSCPWILPFYDHELVDFFSKIPHNFRLGQHLFVETIIDKVFVGKSHSLGDIRRVGKKLNTNQNSIRLTGAFSQVPDFLCGPILRVWPYTRVLQNMLKGLDPANLNISDVNSLLGKKSENYQFIMERIDSISIPQLNTAEIKRIAAGKWIPSEFLSRFVVSAITAQETIVQAQDAWRRNQ